MEKVIKVVIAVVFGIILLGVGVKCTSGYTGLDQGAAQDNALQWAKTMGIENARATCVKMDSDGDGYISCTVMVNDQPVAIECTGWLNINNGCRKPKFNINQ